MFTGLIEAQGTVRRLEPRGTAVWLEIEAPAVIAEDCQIGNSVAINGCCLTVVAINGQQWSFEAGTETLSRTNLGRFAPGDPVNLERALPAAGRLGGHFVQGHVDGVGDVATIERDG